MSLFFAYGSQTGTAEEISLILHREAAKKGL
jgi:hypothetical protein